MSCAVTLEGIVARVREIENCSRNDDEAAHIRENRLRHDVLTAIADGSLDCTPAEAARAVLATSDIEFARWCA